MNGAVAAHRRRLREIAHAAMIERGLLPDFSSAAETEALSARAASAEPGAGIRDLRDLLWCSIDNDDSLDIDQLTAAAPVPDGKIRGLVAIADVDAVVKPDSAIDIHAQTNTTSVYTAAEIFPMLPERLSTGLTSLNESEDRLAIVIEFTVDAAGSVDSPSLYRAIVRNRAKLAYNSVAAWLEGTGPAPEPLAAVPGLEDLLRMQDRTAQALKNLRHRHGALTLETIQTRAVFDGDTLADLLPDEKNRARELIEDFMIAANGVSAAFLESRRLPSLRRVLRSPERWGRIVDLAARSGGRLPSEPDARALEEFLHERSRSDPVRFPDLSLSVVKLLGKGEYAVERPDAPADGHFGLAVRDYSHSTAPNRRFPDLITHRLLKAALAGTPAPYDSDALEALALHCTEQENNAAKVERQVEKSAAALLLASRIGQQFDAIVTGASPKGTWARVFRPPVEGRIVHGFHGLDVGDKVRVELVSTDAEKGHIDFRRA